MSDQTVASVWTSAEIAEFYAQGFWRDEYLTDRLDRWSAEDPKRVFVIEGDVQLTWHDVRARSMAFARSLRELGVGRGDRVAVQLPNWHEFVLTYFGLARVGAVMVPILPVYRDREVAHVLAHSGARAYVYTPVFRGFDYGAMARSLQPDLPDLQWHIVVRPSGEPTDDLLDWAALVEHGEALGDADDFEPPSPDDHHLIVFTSGTESKAKGCLHTWNSYAFTPRNQVGMYGFGRDDIELVASPITHTTGLAAGLLKPLIAGGALCLMDVWDPKVAVDLIDGAGCTQITGATPFLTMLLEAVRARGSGATSLKVFVCGGAPVPAAVVRATSETLEGCRVLPAYGQSEVLLVTGADLDDDERRASESDGKALPGVAIKTVGTDGDVTAAGHEGELCYRSPGQMLGYWRNPEADAASALAGGWRRSGDLGRIDVDGYLRVTGRVKDVIIRGGMNISAREIEELLVAHPDVAAAAVVGVPDPVLGERVGAAVVPAGAAIVSVDALLTYLRDDAKVAKQKLPERVVVLDALPVNATGKVLKFQVVALLEGAEAPSGRP